MREFLRTYYDFQTTRKITIDGKLGYKDHEYVYFIISSDNNKAIHMEQATLSYFLAETGYHQTAFPIPNRFGEWMTKIDQEEYMILKVSQEQQHTSYSSHGELLATFHRQNMAYQYEPQYVSSYGQWKQLWINKLTFLEQYIVERAAKVPHYFFRILMDILPYLIGIGENAIQYVQESEFDNRYNESDQGTICFGRYDDQLLNQIVWPNELVYDHLTRDIAEYIRTNLLRKDHIDKILMFLQHYETVSPLSIFSWRLLYARLIYPIHLFDLIIDVLKSEKYEANINELEDMLEAQVNYEKNLKKLYNHLKARNANINIPLLQWV